MAYADPCNMQNCRWRRGFKQVSEVEIETLVDNIDHDRQELLCIPLARPPAHNPVYGFKADINVPFDQLIWDVGHQCYPHKILTGRRDRIRSLRQKDGLSGFTKRSESEFDPFGAAHSSTSISSTLGMAVAKKLSNNNNNVIAVIGDGAMSAGMAYEAMNNAGALKSKLIVILNDNDMSIARPVGAMSKYLAKILSGKLYFSFRETLKMIISSFSKRFSQKAGKAEDLLRNIVTGGTLFSELGFYYVGPIDGHDVENLVQIFENVKNSNHQGPVLIHVRTQKGKGYKPAEDSGDKYHGVSKFNINTGEQAKSKSNIPSYTKVFAETLIKHAEQDTKIIGITGAMPSGTGLNLFEKKFPDRTFDVGIAEQHAVTFAAGLATEGYKPYAAIYSTFLQRAYDQLIHDVVLQKLDVTLAIDRAGFVGGDGATHAGIFDVSFLRCIPDIVIMSPSDENECWKMLTTAYEYSGPAAVRYPRGEGPGAEIDTNFDSIDIGKARTLREENSDIVIFSFGNMLNLSEEIANELQCSLIDMRFIKPLDEALIEKCAKKYKHLISIEENVISGGGGSAVNEFLSKLGYSEKLKIIGIPDEFPIVGDQEDQREAAGLTKEKIIIQLNADLNLKNINKEVSA